MERLSSGPYHLAANFAIPLTHHRFALLKIFFIIFLIILGLVINLGGIPGVERLGFHYWKTPGPFVEYIGTGKHLNTELSRFASGPLSIFVMLSIANH